MKKSIFLVLSILLIAYGAWATETTVIGGGGYSSGDNAVFGNITATSISVGQGSAGSPSVSLGDGDTGFFEDNDDTISISIAGVYTHAFLSTQLRGILGSSYGLQNEVATATNPVFTFSNDLESGVGGVVNTYVSLIVESAESLRVDKDTTAGNTRFLIYDVDNATLERVTIGAADSGGAGFKVLRIPN